MKINHFLKQAIGACIIFTMAAPAAYAQFYVVNSTSVVCCGVEPHHVYKKKKRHVRAKKTCVRKHHKTTRKWVRHKRHSPRIEVMYVWQPVQCGCDAVWVDAPCCASASFGRIPIPRYRTVRSYNYDYYDYRYEQDLRTGDDIYAEMNINN